MIRCLRDEIRVEGVVEGLLVVRRASEWSNGAHLDGDFVCEPQNASWLADQLDRAADDALPDVEHDAAPDHFIVDVRGGELGAPINVNVLNRRAKTAPQGKTYSFSGMSAETARQLARELRECVNAQSKP